MHDECSKRPSVHTPRGVLLLPLRRSPLGTYAKIKIDATRGNISAKASLKVYKPRLEEYRAYVSGLFLLTAFVAYEILELYRRS